MALRGRDEEPARGPAVCIAITNIPLQLMRRAISNMFDRDKFSATRAKHGTIRWLKLPKVTPGAYLMHLVGIRRPDFPL